MPPKLVAGTKKRDTVTVGNVVLDKDNMSVLYTAPDAPAAGVPIMPPKAIVIRAALP